MTNLFYVLNQQMIVFGNNLSRIKSVFETNHLMLGLPFFKPTIWYSFCLQDKHTDENAHATGYGLWNEVVLLFLYA